MISLDEIKNKSVEEVFQYILTMQSKIEDLSYQLNLAKIHRFGKRADKIDSPLQANLFNEAIEPDNIEEIQKAEATISVSSFQRKKPGRKPLPANLPRVETVHDLIDEDKVCPCGANLTEIGSDKSEQLEYIPATLQVKVHIRKKYACKQCEETIKTAPLPKQPIPKSIASPSLLANIITSKVAYHLPLYRQEQIFRSLGIDIPRNTMSYWFIKCADLLQPLVHCLEKTIQQYDVGYSDETVVQVLKEPNKAPESKSYMWLFAGGPPDKFGFIYQYHPSRSHDVAFNFWQSFKGFLHTDGYAGYSALFNKTEIGGVHCWAHARRNFVNITKTTKKSGLTHWAVAHIRKLYKIESQMKKSGFTADQIKKYRELQAKPLLAEFKAWLDKNASRVPPKSPIGKAIHYCLKFWGNLIRYCDDGRLEIDNNHSERAIKPFVVGRKNWIFCDSVADARAAATFFSLIETCKAHNIDPQKFAICVH